MNDISGTRLISVSSISAVLEQHAVLKIEPKIIFVKNDDKRDKTTIYKNVCSLSESVDSAVGVVIVRGDDSM